MKPVFLNNDNDLIIKCFDNPLAFVRENEADFSIEYLKAIENHKLENTDKFNLEFKCFNYIKRLLGELIKRLPDNLEDFGNGDTSSHIADHANVFMVKGIHRQWKQAASFNFSSGPIKSQKLKSLLLEIIKECKQIGLEVVATVCDQGSANQAVINSLLKNTHNKCIENGVQSTFCGFTTDGTDDVLPL
jgi:hypothetical protein